MLEDGCGTPCDALEERRLTSSWEEVLAMLTGSSMDDDWPFMQNVLSFASQIANEGGFYGSWTIGTWASRRCP